MIRMLSLVTLCATVAAQDKVSPNRFVPKDSLVVARLAAPAAWKQQFGKTLVAKLLEGPTLAPLLAEAGKAFDAGLEEAKKDGKIAPELLDGLLQDYVGEVVFALQVDFADLQAALEEERPPAMSGIISLSPDGKYDLPALATALEKLLESEGGQPLHDLTVGDHRLRFVDDQDVNVSAPTMVDGHLVWLFASDLEKSAAGLLASDDRLEGGTSGASFAVHADLDRAIEGLITAVTAQMAEMAEQMPFDPIALFRDGLGVGCLKALDMSLAADGEHVTMEMSLTTKEGERGLMGMILLDQGAPKLLRFVPPSAEAFSSTPFDLGVLYRTVAKIWTDLGDAVPMSFADAEAAFTEATKVRLKEDLIDHIGTEMLSVGDPGAQFEAIAAAETDEPDPSTMLAGSCYALALRDGKAFGESLEKALRSRGLHAARKTEEYQGVKVHRLRLAAVFEIEYAVTDEMLLLAAGSDEASHQHLRGILDARASGATAPPEAVMKRLQGLPPGWSGIGVTPLDSMLRGISNMGAKMAEQQQQLPDQAAMLFGVLGGVAGDLKQLGLADMLGAVYTTKNSYMARVRW